MEKKEKKPLSAAQGLQAAHILFELNTGAEEILRMAQRSGLPEVFWGGPLAPNLCEEWRAFVHAVVTAGLMQHAPNSVLVAYLRDTGSLLEQAEGHSDAAPHADRLEDFVDGPFSAYMPLLAQAGPQACPALFYRRSGAELPQPEALAVQARLAAVMALLISTLNDKLDAYDIQPEGC